MPPLTDSGTPTGTVAVAQASSEPVTVSEPGSPQSIQEFLLRKCASDPEFATMLGADLVRVLKSLEALRKRRKD